MSGAGPKWNILRDSSSCTEFLYKLIVEHNNVTFQWTNLVEVFEENLTADQLLERCNHLNKAVETTFDRLVDALTTLLNSGSGISVDEKSGKISICNVDDEIPFSWEFRPARTNSVIFYNCVTKRLVQMLAASVEKSKKLEVLLEAKDLELAHLYENGAALTRKSLKTDPFSGSDFDDNFHPGRPGAISFLASVDADNLTRLTAKNSAPVSEPVEPQVSSRSVVPENGRKNDPRSANNNPFARKRSDVPGKKPVPVTKQKLRKL